MKPRIISLRRGFFMSARLITGAPTESTPPLHYMPLVHFFAEASQCMPAFVHSACVFGAPAKAGALNATTRPNANIETRVFICYFLQCRDCFGAGTTWCCQIGFLGCFGMSRVESSQRHYAGGASLWRLSQLAASRHNSLPHPGASASVGALFLFMKANS